MMEPADLRIRHNLSGVSVLNRSPIGGIFVQRKVSPASMIIVEIRNEYSPQMVFIENDDVIEVLSPDRTDHPFNEWVLPR